MSMTLKELQGIKNVLDSNDITYDILATKFTQRTDGLWEANLKHVLNTKNILCSILRQSDGTQLTSSIQVVDKDNIKVILLEKENVRAVLFTNYYKEVTTP